MLRQIAVPFSCHAVMEYDGIWLVRRLGMGIGWGFMIVWHESISQIAYLFEQCFSLSACGAWQITEEWGELNPNWHLEAFGAFYTPFWAACLCYTWNIQSEIRCYEPRSFVGNHVTIRWTNQMDPLDGPNKNISIKTKNVNHFIEYINANIHKTTTNSRRRISLCIFQLNPHQLTKACYYWPCLHWHTPLRISLCFANSVFRHCCSRLQNSLIIHTNALFNEVTDMN